MARAQQVDIGERFRIERQGIAAEGEIAPGPVADVGQAGAKGKIGRVLGIAHEDGAVADPRVACHVLDFFRIAVGAEEGLALVALLHRQATDEVGQEDEGLALELRVFVEVVVDLPGLITDDDVVVLCVQQLAEGEEVARHDLVHRAQREEGLQVVLTRQAFEMPALVGQLFRYGMQPFAFALEIGRRRMDGEPVDLEIAVQGAHLARNGQVPLHVAQADGAGDEERTPLARHAAHPGRTRRAGPDEIAHRAGKGHGVARAHQVPAAAHGEQPCAGHETRDLLALVVRHAHVLVAMDYQRRATDGARLLAHIGADPAGHTHRDGIAVTGTAVANHAVLVLLGRVRLVEDDAEEFVEVGLPVGTHAPSDLLDGGHRRRVGHQPLGVAAGDDDMRNA